MKKHVNTDELDLICQAGLYPYECVDNTKDMKKVRFTHIKQIFFNIQFIWILKKY
jgi:hypothetical protein